MDLSKLSEKNISFFVDLLREIEETRYGEISFSVNLHGGKVANVTSNEFRSKQFKGDNTQAMAEVIQIIKNMVDRKETGPLSFTVMFKDGEIQEVQNQFYNKKNYNLREGV
jgi:hypothetical protein